MQTIVYCHSGYLLPAYTYYRVLRNDSYHGPHPSGLAKLMLPDASKAELRVKVPQIWRHFLHMLNRNSIKYQVYSKVILSKVWQQIEKKKKKKKNQGSMRVLVHT